MRHKKTEHAESILYCENFLKGRCSENEDTCWFKHTPGGGPSRSNEDVPPPPPFRMASGNPVPPDQLSQMFQMNNNN